MKNFSGFILEASPGMKIARQRGWTYTKGGLYGPRGELHAKVEDGKVVYYNKNTVTGGKDPKQSEKQKELTNTTYRQVNSYDYGTDEYEKDLREKYINDEIFAVGDLVKCNTSEKEGKIIRRGANYLICVTEDDEMFKPWIKNVYEHVVNGTTKSGVSADQRLVGTDANRKYVESMVPGSSWGKQFINKYKKKKV
tara:strand:+ start:22 stop:606 length:585 start_codon:yes stop_codon:yes gene_type:complete